MGTFTGIRALLTGVLLVILAAAIAHSENGRDGGAGTMNLEFNPDLNFAQIEYIAAAETSENVWRFEVTVRHNDEGWEHYADAWQVIDPGSGTILGERILVHPHDTEQPFTRSQG